MKRALLLGCLAFGASLSAAQAAAPAAVYSSVCATPREGDLLGRRAVVIRFPDQTYVVFQMAEGGMLPPETAEATLKDGALAFTLKAMGGYEFSGTLSADTLSGTLRNAAGKEKIALKRVRERGAMPACH